MCTPRMYVLVRKDLDETYRCVQGAHAVAKFALEHPAAFREWNNGYLIFLGIRFPREVAEWSARLSAANKVHSVFSEPDQVIDVLDIGQLTAIACYDTGEIFKLLPLA